MKTIKVVSLVLAIFLIANIAVAPASAGILDDIGAFFSGKDTSIPETVSGIDAQNQIIGQIIDSSSNIPDAVNKIVANEEATSMEKLNGIELACGLTEDLKERMAQLTERMNDQQHSTEEGSMMGYELTEADLATLHEFNQYMERFALYYQETAEL